MAATSERLARSRGLAALEATGLDAPLIADRLGCDRTLVAHWFRRARKPTPKYRRAMKKQWKIGEAWWDEDERPLALVKKAKTVTSGTPAEVLSLTPAQSAERARRVALRLLHEAEADDVPPAERGKRLRAATDALQAVDELTGESGKISAAKILSHPEWQRIKEVMTSVLTPEVQLVLGEALRELADA